MSHGPLAEPGILLRMLAPAPEDDRSVAAGVAVGATAADGAAIGRLVLLVAAVLWLAFDAATTLAGCLPPASVRAAPLIAALATGVSALLLRRALPGPRVGAALDLAAMVLLVAATIAGGRQWPGLRIALQAMAAAVVIGGAAAAAARWPRRAGLGCGAAIATGGLAALLHPVALAALGPVGMQASSVALLALAVLARAPQPATPGQPPWRLLFDVGVCALCLWWAGDVVLPDSCAPERVLFGVAAAAALAVLTARAGWPLLALVALASIGAVVWQARCRDLDPRQLTLLAADAHAVAGYDRSSQTMSLTVDGEVVDRAGPEHTGAELAATLLHLFAAPGDRVLVLGVGTGRLPTALLRVGQHEVEVVDARGDADVLRLALAGDGPVPAVRPPAEPRVRRSLQPWLPALAALPDGSRQAIVVAEQPNAGAPSQLTVELQRELRRVVGAGVVLQPFALDLVAAERLRALLAAAAVAHPWNAVLMVGDDAWLLSTSAPPAWPADDVLGGWSDDARWLAHAAHVGGTADVRRAVNGTVLSAAAAAARSELDPPVDAAVVGRRAALGVLHDLLRPEPLAEVVDPRSLLLRWLALQSNLRSAADQLAGLGDSDADIAQAQAIAVRFLPIGAPAACLQAALGLPATDGQPLVDPAQAVCRAHAIDPTFLDARPPVLRVVQRRPTAARGDLEDLASLPEPGRLAELCVGNAPLAVALRVRFGSACARALVGVLAQRPLQPAESEALRELADPFVLDEAGRVLAARHAAVDLLAWWRRDLPMPPALACTLRSADADVALRIVRALGGRSDGDSMRALAECLCAESLTLRQAAATALRESLGDRIAYDPEWPRSTLIEAADRLRSLHNRAP